MISSRTACTPCSLRDNLHLHILHSLPPTIIDIRLQFPRNHGRYALPQPHVPVKRIISLLIQKKLSSSSQSSVRLAKFVEIWCWIEAAVLVMEVEDAAFADVEEEPGVDSASSDIR